MFGYDDEDPNQKSENQDSASYLHHLSSNENGPSVTEEKGATKRVFSTLIAQEIAEDDSLLPPAQTHEDYSGMAIPISPYVSSLHKNVPECEVMEDHHSLIESVQKKKTEEESTKLQAWLEQSPHLHTVKDALLKIHEAEGLTLSQLLKMGERSLEHLCLNDMRLTSTKTQYFIGHVKQTRSQSQDDNMPSQDSSTRFEMK
ncbi:hypothetical protein RFI_15298 [Reticulomyxa filosa]|uniref:Uncharacterized protein n=1 Tax=Reticulomyxa filosa TaxID=46433 RepID=X6N6M2_RETFI|nr:hypothetical protein RFI_15298 [Reticulomyxa filosa]|eukprot:ETO21905.1 hypothetical protein RFI_15298 [Reticulomyxa filosa]